MVSQALADSLAGSVGAVGALLLTYPLKTVYTLQALSGTGTAGQQALSILDVIKRYKLRGLYTGIEPNILESAISNGVYFFLYAQCKRAVISRRLTAQQDASERKSLSTDGALNHGANEHVGEATRKNAAAEKHRVECSTGQDLGILESLLSAAVAGAGNQLLTLPAGVLATRMQAQARLRMDVKDPMQQQQIPTSMLSVARLIYAEGGLFNFWKGLVPSLILLINPALQYAVYEQLLKMMRRAKAKRLRQAALVQAAILPGHEAAAATCAAAESAASATAADSAVQPVAESALSSPADAAAVAKSALTPSQNPGPVSHDAESTAAEAVSVVHTDEAAEHTSRADSWLAMPASPAAGTPPDRGHDSNSSASASSTTISWRRMLGMAGRTHRAVYSSTAASQDAPAAATTPAAAAFIAAAGSHSSNHGSSSSSPSPGGSNHGSGRSSSHGGACQHVHASDESIPLSAGEIFLASALAKVAATILTYPLIVVKSRMQGTTSKTAVGAAVRRRYLTGPGSAWATSTDILANDGLGGFFAGLRAKVLQTALNAALMLMFKEKGAAAIKSRLANPKPIVSVSSSASGSGAGSHGATAGGGGGMKACMQGLLPSPAHVHGLVK